MRRGNQREGLQALQSFVERDAKELANAELGNEGAIRKLQALVQQCLEDGVDPVGVIERTSMVARHLPAEPGVMEALLTLRGNLRRYIALPFDGGTLQHLAETP